jgi:hypothetical protein
MCKIMSIMILFLLPVQVLKVRLSDVHSSQETSAIIAMTFEIKFLYVNSQRKLLALLVTKLTRNLVRHFFKGNLTF